MEIKNLEYHETRWLGSNWNKEELIHFEDDIISHWEKGEIKGPIHLSNGNEEQLIEVFKKISPTDWVFSTWRSHYHALLHGVKPRKLKEKILDGKSITIVDKESNFYVLRNTTMPSVLLEYGFFDTPKDYEFLSNQKNIDKMAKATIEGIVQAIIKLYGKQAWEDHIK